MFAIIATGGKQYRIKENTTLRVEKLPEAARKGDGVVFTDVLLVSDGGASVKIGKPIVPNARVDAKILRDGKADKIRVVKYKPKIRYKRVIGHRQQFTEVRIEKITA
ncbi:MAG: 50S ribosomal protein L21 [Candidatus Komeilibacteria bacterium RIFCSPLOWO2_01_FULL_52_15]|uniref:Large ribosomal subunit protein bL21 n=2 Tax=Candidatus Komeiliibacteriota TaxID=1817908 RepID=A0A1G2BRK4_9BACT|nr:MAG: 50S ribosomal protein L21 [Candidatus Komeilibacteria bacterium RIFCSPHIGHO2_01_FULL_52_14]OGY91000.1 MAG: 50S ribosomal protein L21 [Candidatus Komeilibacteria bacterium RIFCSPLOWO2_01_FULL_52_15]